MDGAGVLGGNASRNLSANWQVASNTGCAAYPSQLGARHSSKVFKSSLNMGILGLGTYAGVNRSVFGGFSHRFMFTAIARFIRRNYSNRATNQFFLAQFQYTANTRSRFRNQTRCGCQRRIPVRRANSPAVSRKRSKARGRNKSRLLWLLISEAAFARRRHKARNSAGPG